MILTKGTWSFRKIGMFDIYYVPAEEYGNELVVNVTFDLDTDEEASFSREIRIPDEDDCEYYADLELQEIQKEWEKTGKIPW